MSTAELLQRAARVLQVTQASWVSAMSTCGVASGRPAVLIDTATIAMRSAPRLVSSRVRTRMRHERIAPVFSTLLIR